MKFTAISFKTVVPGSVTFRLLLGWIRQIIGSIADANPPAQRNETLVCEVTVAPFIVLITLFVLFSIAGYFHLPVSNGWWTSLRLALSGMFLLTASAHWGRRRADLIQMVPPVFSRPDVLVTVTGIFEILGAWGSCCRRLSLMPLSG